MTPRSINRERRQDRNLVEIHGGYRGLYSGLMDASDDSTIDNMNGDVIDRDSTIRVTPTTIECKSGKTDEKKGVVDISR
jgi:hypothetical protein